MPLPAAPPESPYPRPAALAARDQPDTQNQDCSSNAEYEEAAFQRFFKDLPQYPMPDFDENKLHHMPDGSKDSGWQQCLKAVEKHDADLCQAYREQIDTLLVFAGIFSAVVTAFAVESFQWLLDDPADTSAELLRDVVHLLAQSLNQTILPVRPNAARLSDAAIAHINVFWFLSLTLSLSAALVGILCKQWLREFERDIGQSPETALGVRFIRYQGLSYWKVGSIVNSVPILLQVSLALFLTGVVELLWRISFTVAICVTMVVAVTLAFYMATTLLPLIQYTNTILRLRGELSPEIEIHLMHKAFAEPQCAFKSAQAWIVLRAFQPILEYLMEKHCHTLLAYTHRYSLMLRPADSWITFDINWMKRRDCIHWGPRSAYETLAWVTANIDERHLSSSIWQCAWARWLQSTSVQDDHFPASFDLECVARAFPEPIHLDNKTNWYIRAQAALYRCSLHTTIDSNTAVEMILRIAPEVGVNSLWTCEAMKTVRALYRDQSICLSQEMAFGLLRLASLQIQAIVQRSIPAGESENSIAQPTAAFSEGFELLCAGAAEFHKHILPAMCGLALQLLKAHPDQISARPPRRSNADCAKMMVNTMISYYTADTACDPSRLRDYPGIIFPARLARMVVDLDPSLVRVYAAMVLHQHRTLLTLLEISSTFGNVAVCTSSSATPPITPPVASIQDGEVGVTPSAPAARIPSVAPVNDGKRDLQPSAMPGHVTIHVDAATEPDSNSAASLAQIPATSEPE